MPPAVTPIAVANNPAKIPTTPIKGPSTNIRLKNPRPRVANTALVIFTAVVSFSACATTMLALN